jgi:hypothetical protein
MRQIIASDLHGSALYCQQLLDRLAIERAEQLIFLGDILYHGPRNDLPEGYAPKEVISLLNPLKDRIVCVRGNCDAEVDQMVLDFPILQESRLLTLQNRPILLTHGHHCNPDQPADDTLLSGAQFVLFGHTHIPCKQNVNGVWYLNPGSLSIPKADSHHSYLLLTEDGFTWKSLDGEAYDSLPFSAI